MDALLLERQAEDLLAVELPQRLIELYTFEGDLVLDPFMGVGSTAVAAIETGRNYVGYEINDEYVELALKRLAALPPP